VSLPAASNRTLRADVGAAANNQSQEMTMMQHRNTSREATSIWEAYHAPERRRFEHENPENSALYALLTIVAILALLLVVVTSKPALSQGVQLVKVDVTAVGKGYRAAKLAGQTVVNEKNEKIGTLDDIILGKDRAMYAILQVGGFLGLGSRLVAVPFDSLKIDEAGRRIELPGASKDELTKLAEFKYLT
jgi:hypothetical protein